MYLAKNSYLDYVKNPQSSTVKEINTNKQTIVLEKGQNMKRHFIKEGIWMANKYMKK